MEINSIDQIPEILVHHLGQEFIKQKVAAFDPIGKNSIELSKLEAKLHPMHDDWYKLQLAINESNFTNSERINQGAAYLTRLVALLEKTKKVEDIAEITERIKNNQTYHSAVFELEVLAFYLERNISISVVKTSSSKTSDFLIEIDNEQYCVEAKLLQNNIFETERKWKFLLEKITNLALKNRCCLDVHIKTYDIFEKVNFNEIYEQIVHWSKQSLMPSDSFEFNSSDGAYSLRVGCTDFWGDITIYEEGQPILGLPESTISSSVAKVRRTHLNQTEVSNRITVIIEPFARLDFGTSIVSNLRKASKQSIANKSIIVHIGIPHTTSKDTFQIFETSLHQVHRRLNGSSKKISGVLMQSFSMDVRHDFSNFNNNFVIIPNCNGTTDIPLALMKFINLETLPEDFDFKDITISLDIDKVIKRNKENISANLAYCLSDSARVQFRVFNSDKFGGCIAFQKVILKHNIIDTQYVLLKHIKNSKLLKIDWENERFNVTDNAGSVKTK